METSFAFLMPTYRTNKYSLPLFFFVVKINVKYQVVGYFVIQDGKTSSILEVLEIFKAWNPDWSQGSS